MGKGGGSAPSTQTVQQTNLPDYAEPYFKRLLQRTEGLSLEGYQPYQGQRIAESPSDLTASYDMARNVATTGISGLPQAQSVVSGNILAGRQLAGSASPYFFGPSQFSQAQFAPSQFQQADFSPRSVSPFAGFQERTGQQFEFDPTQQFTGETVQQYMSPYMQSVVEAQQRDARQQFQEQSAGRRAQAVQAGAFGGSRQAVQEAIAERDLLDRLSDIQSVGSQEAFQQAAQQFGADRAAGFARQQAQAGELARTQGMSREEAARVQAARAAELARAQGIDVSEAGRVEAARAQEIARLDAARAAEQARVEAARAGELGRVESADAAERARVEAAQSAENRAARQEQLQALGFSSEQAQQLVGLGETERATGIQGSQLLETIGKSQLAREQEALDMAYQDFIRQQAYPEQQLQMYSSILRGVPVQPGITTTAYAPYNPLQQALGAGLGAIGLYRGLTG